MARRRNGLLGLVGGFEQGYDLVSKVLRDRDMAKVMEEQPETGYTDQQAADLRAAEASGQYDIAANPDGTYAVTPKAGGETGQMAPGVKLLGQQFDKAPNPQQIDKARMIAMSGVMSKHGNPIAAMQLRQQASQAEQMEKQGKLTDMQIAGAERQERSAVQDEDYRNGLPDLMKSSRMAAAQAEGRRYTPGDALADNAALLAYQQKNGKVDPDKWMSLASAMEKVETEGYHKALTLADAGASLDQVAQAYNASGTSKFDPKAVVSDKQGTIVLRGQQIPTRVIQFKDAKGDVQTINTASELAGLGDAKALLETHFAGQRDKRDGQRLGMEGARIGLAQQEAERSKERWGIEKKDLQARADDSAAQREARKGLQAAIETGDQKAIDLAQRKAIAAGVKFEKPSLEFTTTVDQMGNAIVRTNKDTGEMDIVDRQSGAVKNIPAPGRQTTPTFGTEAEAERAKKEGKIKAGDRILINGRPVAVN